MKLIKNTVKAKDPPRFPGVSNVYETQSMKDFKGSLQLEFSQLIKKMKEFT